MLQLLESLSQNCPVECFVFRISRQTLFHFTLSSRKESSIVDGNCGNNSRSRSFIINGHWFANVMEGTAKNGPIQTIIFLNRQQVRLIANTTYLLQKQPCFSSWRFLRTVRQQDRLVLCFIGFSSLTRSTTVA
jgi:hypothetical protein